METWNILGIIAILFLLIFFRSRNSAWAFLTLGVVIGLIVGLIYLIKGDGFNWSLLKKIAVVSTLIGGVFEVLERLFLKKTAK